MTRKMLASATVAGLAIAACAAGGGTAAAGTTASAAKVHGSPIIFGLATPLTGSNPSEGTSEDTIAKDVVASINQAGGVNGHPVKLVVRDTGGASPTGAVTAFESLVQAGAKVVLGEWTSTNFEAACTVAMKEHVVLIGHASATDGLTTGMTYCFRNEYQVHQSTGAMFGVAKALHLTPIAIAADTTSFGAAEADSWAKLAPRYNVKVVANVNWSSPAATLTAQVLQLAHSGAKSVFVGSGSGPDVTLLAKTMVQLGVKIPIFGPGGINAPGVPTAAGAAYSALPEVLNITSYDSNKPAALAFMNKISKQTGIQQGGGNPARLWDAFKTAAAALAKTNGNGGMALVKALEHLGKFDTLTGGPGTYELYSAKQHSGLFGPLMLSVYKWSSATNSFVYQRSLSALADKSPGVNSPS